VALLLSSLSDFRPAPRRPGGPATLAKVLEAESPLTVILLTEPLTPQHWRYRKYVKIRRVKTCCELDEVVFREFGRELNEQMAEYLRDHSDLEDAHLRTLVKSYYPRARRVLLAEYRERHPRSWKKKWAGRRHIEPRVKIERKRRFEMPVPLSHGETLAPQQFYFMRHSRTWARGCSTGSGTRETHSCFALALAALRDRVDVPSHVLIYDRDNRLRFVHSEDTLLLVPDSIGANCDVPPQEVRDTLEGVTTVRYSRSSDYTRIDEVILAGQSGSSGDSIERR
jgi:hypothetical protein